MNYNIVKLTENKWFKLFDKLNDLSTNDFLENIKENEKLYILLQYDGNNGVGIYGVIKNKGLYGFTTKKNEFFKGFDLETKELSFIINDKQNIWTFINIFELMLKNNGKTLKKDVDIVYYEDEIDCLIK